MYYALTPAAIRSVDCIIIPTGAVGYRPCFPKRESWINECEGFARESPTRADLAGDSTKV